MESDAALSPSRMPMMKPLSMVKDLVRSCWKNKAVKIDERERRPRPSFLILT